MLVICSLELDIIGSESIPERSFKELSVTYEKPWRSVKILGEPCDRAPVGDGAPSGAADCVQRVSCSDAARRSGGRALADFLKLPFSLETRFLAKATWVAATPAQDLLAAVEPAQGGRGCLCGPFR